jgi:uncharacterized glyoxalase superfamily protein PhnB
MLSVFLACDDPYEMACVALGDAEVMLGTAEEQYLPTASRDHRGAGVTVYIRVDAIDGIWVRHEAAGVITTPLSELPWGERAFDAVIAGYRFLIAEEART